MPRLTEEQALAGLRNIWLDVCGRPKNPEIPQSDDNVVDFIRNSRHFDSLDEVDFVIGMHTFFGGKVTDQDVINWFSGGIDDPYGKNFAKWERDIKPTLTFGRLAQWICDRASAPSFAPINVAGCNCGPAGAFMGIAETVQTIAPGDRFPPRTPILSRLRGGQLDRGWQRLNAYTGGRLPDLKFPHRKSSDALVLALFLVGFAGSMILAVAGHGIWIAALLPACFVAVWGALKLSMSGNPLPPDIQTFRDLAYAMSAIMNGPESEKVPPDRSLG